MSKHCSALLFLLLFGFSYQTKGQVTANDGYTSAIRAVDDYATIFQNNNKEIDITANDTIIGNPIIEIITGSGNGPHYGVADTIGSNIIYTPDPDFQGRDSLQYILKCEYAGDTLASVDTAYAYILVVEKPDNIIDAECYITPLETTWSIREDSLNKSHLLHNYAPIMVGDIDEDSIIEIIGLKETTNYDYDDNSPGIKIFYYDQTTQSIELKNEFLFASTGGATVGAFGAIAIARYNDEGYIVVAGTDKYLYAYTPTGQPVWKSDTQYRTNSYSAILGIADFNNDGIPEVYTGNQIFSLSNGFLLCDGGSSGNSGVLYSRAGHNSAVADIDGNGTLELIASTTTYKVTITNNNGIGGNSIAPIPGLQLTTALPPQAYRDGATQVIDIDNDGELEVVVITVNESQRVVAYVWKPLPDNKSYVMGSYLVPSTNVIHYSIPLLGNIDEDKYPEIIFITDGSLFNMYALKFNPAGTPGNQLALKWILPHDDTSGCTGATLFNFNQDKRNEIVYRDMNSLRIIDGSASIPATRAIFTDVHSATLREYPVIANIDDDGQAEIIVTGWDNKPNTVNGITSNTGNAYLRIFKSNGTTWAPARKVWNQYAYNAININEDLSVPKFRLNLSTLFPGENGIGGTRPYNTLLQQQTILDIFGKTRRHIYRLDRFKWYNSSDAGTYSHRIERSTDVLC